MNLKWVENIQQINKELSLDNWIFIIICLCYYHGVHGKKHCFLHYIVSLESYVLGIGTCNFEICCCYLFLLVISNIVVITFYN